VFFHVNSEQVQAGKNTITMVTMDQIPYAFLSINGEQTGVLFDILNKISQESGIGKSNQIVPSKRIFSYLTQNDNTCTIVADVSTITTNFDLIEPIGYTLSVGILPRAGINLTEYADLAKLTIAVPLGIIFDDNFHNDKSLNKISPPQYSNAIQMMKKGRVDAIAGAFSSLKYIAKMHGMVPNDFGSPLIMKQNELNLVCSKKVAKATREKLKNTVVTLKKNKSIETIIKRYLDEGDF